ncbi:Protein LCHN [Erysiphe neolycopersici]|uniref:Protein LCHN n=1 Tax=Erysiphe neolycopersici TaxID=212602 RepID=A0A420HL31_9PEZI|nr:Protein LCHN [Erysiphe neolycopersici]
MAVARRRQALLNIGLSGNLIKSELCPLSALFLIYFDNKAGYAVSWKRSLPGVEVEGVVEYKSLPSGAHSVKNDFIYFIHGDHTGLSAFINVPAAEESRNARMIAVGILVPVSGETLGRCWEHAEVLKEMAKSIEPDFIRSSKLIDDTKNTQVLEDYWEKHKVRTFLHETSILQQSSPTGAGFKSLPNSPRLPRSHNRGRSLSDSQLLHSDVHTLSTHHPVRSMVNLLDTFGPLIFPIYRAALLRQRILLTTHAPVQETCNFVYNISILSSIPLAGRHILEQNNSSQSLRPLYSIGVHDIPFLEDELEYSKTISNTPQSVPLKSTGISSRGWIACTTDSILSMKHVLYDVLVKMPPISSGSDGGKSWPRIESPYGFEVKATQRDFRRYRALQSALSSQDTSFQDFTQKSSNSSHSFNEPHISHIISHDSSISYKDALSEQSAMKSIIEPVSWSAFAYSNFSWWISSGERQSELFNESESDLLLLSNLLPNPRSIPMTFRVPLHYTTASTILDGSRTNAPDKNSPASLEMAIVDYFHRMTIQILSTLENITTTSDLEEEQFDENNPLQGNSENSEYESRSPIIVSSADVIKMGLDLWSDGDHRFIQKLAREYTGRRSLIEGLRLEMCGITIC